MDGDITGAKMALLSTSTFMASLVQTVGRVESLGKDAMVVCDRSEI